MCSVTEHNRLPKVIYVRRRVAAVVVLLAVVALLLGVMQLFSNRSADQPDQSAAAVTSDAPYAAKGTDGASAGKDGDDKAASSDKKDADKADKDSKDAGDKADKAGNDSKDDKDSKDGKDSAEEPKKQSCELSDLQISATSDKPSYEEGQLPEFYMTVKNPTAADCTIDLRDNPLRFEVYNLSTNRRVWSDLDCNQPVDGTSRIFPAGSERYYRAVWSRTDSEPGKCGQRNPVPAGSYFLHTVIGNNPSEAHPFNLL